MWYIVCITLYLCANKYKIKIDFCTVYKHKPLFTQCMQISTVWTHPHSLPWIVGCQTSHCWCTGHTGAGGSPNFPEVMDIQYNIQSNNLLYPQGSPQGCPQGSPRVLPSYTAPTSPPEWVPHLALDHFQKFIWRFCCCSLQSSKNFCSTCKPVQLDKIKQFFNRTVQLNNRLDQLFNRLVEVQLGGYC